jgi:hypothetical protein
MGTRVNTCEHAQVCECVFGCAHALACVHVCLYMCVGVCTWALFLLTFVPVLPSARMSLLLPLHARSHGHSQSQGERHCL